MDLKNEINSVLNDIGDDLKGIIIGSSIVHIERAEHFFNLAKMENDDQYYTDVIYRTNQAYEGILKIIYLCFTGGGDGECNLSTFELEQYFEKQQVSNERVKFAFTSYRTKWRNPSIHEYGLFFCKDEALLAIINVSAFIYILLNQLAEQRSTKKLMEMMEMIVGEETAEYHVENPQQDTNETIIELLKNFHKVPVDGIISGNNMSQIIGALKGYLLCKISGLEIMTDCEGADMVINNNQGDKLIIEVKNGFTKEKLKYGYKQLEKYMSRFKVKQGILYFYSNIIGSEYEVVKELANKRIIVIMKPN